MQLTDPLLMPVTGETPQQRLDLSVPLTKTDGQQYVEKRGISLTIAANAGVRFDPEWNGRPAVIVPMLNNQQELCSVHGRYLLQAGKQDKMFTIGPGGGAFWINDALQNDYVIIVEGVFDALSLATCGYYSIATVGRLAHWLPAACTGKKVVLAFDGNKPGHAMAAFYERYLSGSKTFRLAPPDNLKDWNSALLKRNKAIVAQWLCRNLSGF